LIHIALDAMGGDHAPAVVVEGGVLAVQQLGVRVSLVGPEDVIRRELARFPSANLDLVSVVHAPDVVGMAESPAVAFRQKKASSIHVGLKLVKDKLADGFVSAGNTGAVMMASTLILGRMEGVERPAIASLIPTKTDRPVLVLDMGSSVDCKAEHLAQFALMGHTFAKTVLKQESPRVGLLNIGEEPEKGNEVVKEAFELITQLPIHFVGNVEGKDILDGVADVVVCDGFVGNALLKFGEGVSSTIFGFFKHQAKSGSLRSKLGLLLLKPALMEFKKKYDYEEYGGAPLLGVNGISIIAHGRSSAIAIKNAIRLAKNEATARISIPVSTEMPSL